MPQYICAICGGEFQLDQAYDVCSLACEQKRLEIEANVGLLHARLVTAIREFLVANPDCTDTEIISVLGLLLARYQPGPALSAEELEFERDMAGPDPRPGLTGEHLTFELDMKDADIAKIMTIEEMIAQLVIDTGEAKIKEIAGVRGVLFLDEGEFISFENLGYNHKLGFYKKSLFPDVEDESAPKV